MVPDIPPSFIWLTEVSLWPKTWCFWNTKFGTKFFQTKRLGAKVSLSWLGTKFGTKFSKLQNLVLDIPPSLRKNQYYALTHQVFGFSKTWCQNQNLVPTHQVYLSQICFNFKNTVFWLWKTLSQFLKNLVPLCCT